MTRIVSVVLLQESGGEEGVDTVNQGSSVMVYHYVAANYFRMMLARFLAPRYSLDPVQIAARMNQLAEIAFKNEAEASASGKPKYVATFAA